MTDLRFHGFPGGARVDLSVTHDDTTLSAVVEAWPDPAASASTYQHNNGPDGDDPDGGDGTGTGDGTGGDTGDGTGGTGSDGTATLAILPIHNAHAVAPESIWFDTDLQGVALPTRTALWDAQMHQVDYVWDFGDGGSHGKSARLPADWALRNAGWGKRVGHVYKEPGTYTVTCTAYLPTHDGAVHGYRVLATAAMDVTVAAPETLYSGNRTIVIDPDGDFSGAPAGAQTATTLTEARALTTVEGPVKDGGARLLLRRGKVHVHSGGFALGGGRNSHWWVGAFGTGARPVLDAVAGSGDAFRNVGSQKSRLVLQGLDFRGGWDSAIETGNLRTAVSLDAPLNLVVDDCTCDGMSNFLKVAGPGCEPDTQYEHMVAVNDTDVTNWQDYGIGIFGGDDYVYVLTGNKVAQAQGASTFNGGGKDGLHNQHGPVRIARLTACYIAQNDLYSRNSWGSTQFYQPCLRLNTAGSPYRDGGASPVMYVGHNVAEAGTEPIATDRGGNHETLHGVNCLIERNLLLGGCATRFAVTLDQGGTTFRGNYFVMPDVPKYGTPFGSWVRIESLEDNTDPTNWLEPVRVIGNTFVNLQSDAGDMKNPLTEHDLRVRIEGSPYAIEQIEVRDNVTYVPNAGGGYSDTAMAPLETLFHVTPYEVTGPRTEVPPESGTYVDQTDKATPPLGLPVMALATGSAALDAATDVGTVLPFFGDVPRSAVHKGAL